MREERELKFRVEESRGSLRRRLIDLGAREVTASGLEQNWVFDRGEELRAGESILRLRIDSAGVRLTLKGPARFEGGIKIREELELSVSDAETMHALLGRLGFVVVTRYEKHREEWDIEGTLVALDRTPIGDFMEFEGDTAEEVARRCGYDPGHAESRSYLQLYEDHRREHPESPPDMVFP